MQNMCTIYESRALGFFLMMQMRISLPKEMSIRACLDLGPGPLVNEGQYVPCGMQMGPQGH
jgi:hypothetical protein